MALSRRLRFEILRRDGNTCRYCGAMAPDVALTVDHVIPAALGGGDDPRNLVTACADCNAGKASISPDSALVDDVDATAMLFASALERAAAKRREDKAATQLALKNFETYWTGWTWTDRLGQAHSIALPDDWQGSVERFLALGLTAQELYELADEAMLVRNVRDEFRLFCKKAWNEINERHELARRLIEDGDI